MMMNMTMTNTNLDHYTDNIFTILNLRSQWEDIALNGRSTYKLINEDSTIDTLKWFVNSGSKSNRFRKNFKQALSLANDIVNYYENSNLSGICRQEISSS